jgi:segregation and condensation protein A
VSEEADLDLAGVAEAASDGDGLVLDLEGYEGPLHVLLDLARSQKVDLARISLVALTDQYLAFIDRARAHRIELAADYLVIAAWLTLIKSRLLLPKAERAADEPSEEEIAAALARKLKRLEEARAAAKLIDALPQLGREVFAFGRPRPVIVSTTPAWKDDLYDLLRAYGGNAARRFKKRRHTVRERKAYPLEQARARLADMIPDLVEWRPFETLPPQREGAETVSVQSFLASTFGAALELVKEGKLEARQSGAFGPLFLRKRGGAA